MSADQPFFRFHPGAYDPARGSFRASNDPCGVCGDPCVWLYVGHIYAVTRPAVCARCIANGNLKAFIEDGFSFHDTQLEGADPDLEAEVLEATPGFATFNPFDWPVLDGKPLAFIGYGDEPALWAIPGVRTAISEAFEDDIDKPTPYALVFKELDGTRYAAAMDFD